MAWEPPAAGNAWKPAHDRVKAIGGGVQGQKSDLILDESTFHCGFNAANRVAKFSTVLEIRAVEVRAFFALLGNLGSKIG